MCCRQMQLLLTWLSVAALLRAPLRERASTIGRLLQPLPPRNRRAAACKATACCALHGCCWALSAIIRALRLSQSPFRPGRRPEDAVDRVLAVLAGAVLRAVWGRTRRDGAVVAS
jgi:hypothetical protein